MDSFSPSPGTSPATAPSNLMRACQGCNGAKVKCTARADDDSNSPLRCARCFRLKKECLPILPKTRKRRSPNAITRTANLEKKLEDLVSLLAAQQQPSSTFVSPAPVSGEDLHDNHYSRASSIPSSQTVSAFEAVELLTRYRTCLTPNFPFVIIADDMSAQQLQQQKPYLFESILMAASYRDPDCQAAMAKEILRKLTTSIVLKAESNLDILQALIVYIAWFHLHSHIRQVTSVLHLAMGLVSDLGLKNPQLKEKRDVIGYTINSETRIEQNGEVHSPDEKRAFLGCFMLASMASMCLKISDGFRYLPYIDTCCDSLSSQAGHNSDYILSVSVRLQGIIERMQDTFSHGHGASKDCRPPLYLQVNFYCKELELFKSSLPLHIQQDYHIALQYHNAKLNLYESVIQKTPNSDYTPASLQQLDMLHGCVLACKQFFDVCFMMTPENFATLAFLDFGRLGYALATLFKLSLFEAPGWDLAHVRKTIDLSVVLGRLIYQFERTINPATTRQDIAQANDAFTLGARRLRRVKEWVDANPPATEHGAEKQSHGAFLPFSDFGNFDMNDPCHFFDEISWQEITGTLDIVP